jgi:hypothetical protein
VASGALPSWATLDTSTGAIAGTVSGSPGTATFTLAYGTVTSGSLSITTAAAPSITTGSLPSGTVGTAYSQTLAAAGGTPPLVWSVSSGVLPTGTSLSSGGVLAGTPTVAGVYSFTVLLTEANGRTDSKALSVTINSAGAGSGTSASGNVSVSGRRNE